MEVNTDAAIQKLLALEEVFLNVLETFRNKRKVLEKIKLRNQLLGASESASDITQTDPLPRENSALARIQKLVEVQLCDLKKKIHAELDQITSSNYNMDLSGLFASNVGSVISSFRAVSPETLHGALGTFTDTGENFQRRSPPSAVCRQ
uniref:Uncharacterized protein n=1 Tax=Chromera velia CCMP2878 TaxID=1169474 RepID=A0A0G4GBZ5_9ALVE|eukprot:Cvel_21219.t1-p1 / transcript=Cvel_21219.t1 / gene=Cvel_21219 / organism=Chromera_velia_CCMP2878 / gene_product=hypothetical protein / transcript_product=hypothetical protein / location=Cvel_scaffold1971:24484-24927(-) / protein_length=148 / sequence_SO=supercontig / SO=protein_coding / is_pseudo=false